MSEKEKIDLYVVAERIAETVNKKMGFLDRRLSELESKVKRLEIDVNTIRSQTIETIVRSVLNVKVEDIASSVAVKVASDITSSISQLSGISKEIRDAVEELRKTTRELMSLKKIPSEVAESIRKIKVNVDTSRLEASISTTISKSLRIVGELSGKMSDLDKRLEELNQQIAKLGGILTVLGNLESKINGLGQTLDEMSEAVGYIKEVSSILEEQIRKVESEEEEGEEE